MIINIHLLPAQPRSSFHVSWSLQVFRPQIMRKNQIEIYGMRSEVIETAATANGVKIHTMDGHLQVILSSLYQFHVPAVSFRSIIGNILLTCIDHAMVASFFPLEHNFIEFILLFLHINERLCNFID